MSSKLLQPRAWYKQNQEMVMVTMILFASEEIDYSGNLGEPKHIDHFEIMYPTGQVDKNNKQVYDGDIVKVGGLIEQVSYFDGILICYSHKIYGEPKNITVDNYEDYVVTESDYFRSYEIIGHIYKIINK
jgi:uncharacterized phage protein (TIGR01671 family)